MYLPWQSIKYWVADEVKDYILANKLYDPPQAKANGHTPVGNGQPPAGNGV